ncbi:hypothetical protein [Desulfobacter postgatei]|uniref:hypothetical protein n=1 Tax=Desulfobacter postgatei TaxID=2293 RepID=UPI00259BB81D|nr:hypothetical protein [uncultured Desulfobacter sp.]
MKYSTAISITTIETMSSSQFAEMTGMTKSHINAKIRKEFKEEIDDRKIDHQTDSRGYVIEYHLPELESKMLAALLDKSYLRKITEFWIEKNSKVLSPAEQLLENAKRLVAHERELSAIRDRQDVLEREQFETKVQVAALVEGEGYYTIVGYCNLHNKKVDSKQAAELGKRAAEICRNNSFSIGSASHPLYGKVNTYPQDVLARIIK